MKSKAFWLRICVLLTMLVMVGCGPQLQLRKMYEAPTLPEDRIAFLAYGRRTIWIVSLDGNKGIRFRGSYIMELLPGTHSVSVKFSEARGHTKIWSPKPINLTFDAKAGHIYAIEYATDVSILSPGVLASGGYWNAWIEDVTTNPVFQKDVKNLDRRPDPNLTEAEIYCRRGLAYANKDRYDRALVDLNKSVELNPKTAWPYINRAKAYNGKGLYDHAISDCNKAIEIMPRSFMAFHNQGVAFFGKGFYDEAISDFNKAIEINPKYVLAYRNKGDTYLQKGMYESAISDFTNAIRMDKPQVPDSK